MNIVDTTVVLQAAKAKTGPYQHAELRREQVETTSNRSKSFDRYTSSAANDASFASLLTKAMTNAVQHKEANTQLSSSHKGLVESIQNIGSFLEKSMRGDAPLKFQTTTKLNSGESVTVNFSPDLEADKKDALIFTTESNNLTISLDGVKEKRDLTDVATVVNKTDALVNRFYKTEVESALKRLLNAGYDVNTIANGSVKQVNPSAPESILAYQSVGNSTTSQQKRDFIAVNEYVSDLVQTSNLAKEVFASQNEYKQVINGIVNQLKDVQVPDLLSAINRLHEFNGQFSV